MLLYRSLYRIMSRELSAYMWFCAQNWFWYFSNGITILANILNIKIRVYVHNCCWRRKAEIMEILIKRTTSLGYLLRLVDIISDRVHWHILTKTKKKIFGVVCFSFSFCFCFGILRRIFNFLRFILNVCWLKRRYMIRKEKWGWNNFEIHWIYSP